MNDDPLIFAMEKVVNANLQMGRNMRNMLGEDIPDMTVLMERVINNVRESAASWSMAYKDINPPLTSRDICKVKHYINEFHCLAFTSFRVCGYT